jgi:hypothetical protein
VYSLWVDEIYHKNKCVTSRFWHSQIKRNCCNTRIQSWHHIDFHSFGHQQNNDMFNHLFLVWKHNLGSLMHDQAPQTLTLHNKNNPISFGNKQLQAFHECILPYILFLIRNNTPKMFCDGPISNISSFLGLILCYFYATKAKLTFFHLLEAPRCLKIYASSWN